MAETVQVQGTGKATVIDATGLVLGRLATHVAKRLLQGETVHVVNAEKAVITGTKASVMERFEFKRNVGTQRKGPFSPRMPHMMVKRTVRGMLDYQDKPSHRAAFKRLRCHIGVPDELEGQTPQTIEKAKTTAHRKITVEAIARDLGAKF